MWSSLLPTYSLVGARLTWEQFFRGRLEEFESYCEPEQDRVKMQFLVRFSEVIGNSGVLQQKIVGSSSKSNVEGIRRPL